MKEKQRKPACEEKECYESITHTMTVKITYADNIEGDCPVLQPVDQAKYVKQARGVFRACAEAHCKFGDEDGSKTQCESPCECKPKISDVNTETLGTGKWPDSKKCYVKIKVSGTINCKCEND